MIRALVTGNLREAMEGEVRATAGALRRAAESTGREVQAALRQQARQAGFADGGRAIANAWRLTVYPRPGVGPRSLRPAAFVTSNMDVIVAAFEIGAIVRPQPGGFLAVPLPAAGKGPRGRRITPAEFEQRTGLRLRMVYRRRRPALLVADNARLGRSGLARANITRGRRGTYTRLKGRTTVPVFVLLPQVKLRRMLDVAGERGRAAGRLAAAVVRELGALPR